ncbi:MAG: fatty acid desaturase [Bdellovibrionales bacterium]
METRMGSVTSDTESNKAATEDQPVEPKVEKKVIKNIGYYARAIMGDLPKDLLKPTPGRIVWAVFFYSIISVSVFALVTQPELPVILKVVLGLVIGYGFGGAAFLAHEVLHGSVFRSKTLQDSYGFFGFAPFLIAPTFWRFWHNRLHHGHTQKIIMDPDAFPTMRIYKQSKYMQNAFNFTPGSGTFRSIFYFFYWFSWHNLANQVYLRFRNKIFADMGHMRVSIEFILQLSMMAGYCYLLGWQNAVYGAVIPFAVMNYILMSYISTNHNVSPLTKHNDPLENSLTVTNHKIFEFMHMNFGYHVEHHLFPTMNPSKAKAVHEVLKKRYPEQYKIMPKWDALKLLYKTPRVYKNSKELIHPHSGETHPTI